MEDIMNYDMQGIRLAHSIDEIRSTISARSFTVDPWPKGKPTRWKFEKKSDGDSEVYEVRLDSDGTVKSIRYQKSVRYGDGQAIDLDAEHATLSSMATGKNDNCSTYPRGGFQCILHARKGKQRASLSARTGRGTVYFNASR